MQRSTYGELDVFVAGSTEQMSLAAADEFASAVRAACEARGEIAVVLATGNSQLRFVQAVRERPDVDWSRITIMHMDEYLGMRQDHPASFRRWMRENLIQYVDPRGFYGIAGEHEPVEEECQRYSELLRRLEPAICVMGIGENGHLAFNDPPADFETRELVQVVQLDEPCRRQQVGEGHFASLDDVPHSAVTLTIGALLRPETVLVLVPELRKAKAIRSALKGPVSPACPASILRLASHARLFLDDDSASLVDLDHHATGASTEE